MWPRCHMMHQRIMLILGRMEHRQRFFEGSMKSPPIRISYNFLRIMPKRPLMCFGMGMARATTITSVKKTTTTTMKTKRRIHHHPMTRKTRTSNSRRHSITCINRPFSSTHYYKESLSWDYWFMYKKCIEKCRVHCFTTVQRYRDPCKLVGHG